MQLLKRFINRLVHSNLTRWFSRNSILKKRDFEKWKMELNTKENMIKKQGSDVGEAFKFGQMVQDMKDIGSLIKLMDRDD